MPHARTTRTSDRTSAWARIIALLLAGAGAGAGPAHAQLGGSVSLQSDPRYRGVSLNGGKPQAQLNLVYDTTAGWYGGAMLAQMRFDAQRRSSLLLGYLGRVVPLAPGLDAEAGITATRFADLPGYDYAEAYVGLLAERWSARVYYSGDYFGRSQRSLYAELGLNWPLLPALQAFAHLGALTGTQGANRNPHGATRFDVRAGVAWREGPFEFQLAGVAVDRGGPYARSYEPRRSTLVLGALVSF